MDLGCQLGGPGGSASVVLVSLLALGVLLGPTWPQEDPRSSKAAPETDLGTIFIVFHVSIWWIFCNFFDRCSVEFRCVGALVCWWSGCLLGMFA